MNTQLPVETVGKKPAKPATGSQSANIPPDTRVNIKTPRYKGEVSPMLPSQTEKKIAGGTVSVKSKDGKDSQSPAVAVEKTPAKAKTANQSANNIAGSQVHGVRPIASKKTKGKEPVLPELKKRLRAREFSLAKDCLADLRNLAKAEYKDATGDQLARAIARSVQTAANMDPEIPDDKRADAVKAAFVLERKLRQTLEAKNFGLAERSMGFVLSKVRDELHLVKDQRFIDAVARSINAVTCALPQIPDHMQTLAFMLNFNLDCNSLLKATVTSNLDIAWEKMVFEKLGDGLGQTAKLTIKSARGQSAAMLLKPEEGMTVLHNSRPLAEKLLTKVLPQDCTDLRTAGQCFNMSIALRNLSIRQIEVHGSMDRKLETAVVREARALLEKGGQVNHTTWTIALMQVANAYRAEHSSPA